MKDYLTIIILALSLIACKSDKKAENNLEKEDYINLDEDQKPQTEEIKDFDRFIVTVEAIVKKDDKFNLMYLTDEITSWSPEGLIKKEIQGNDFSQKIQFKFPAGEFPTKFRIDLGTNKDQQFIDFYKIKFEYQGKELEVDEKMIGKYFIPNKYASFSQDDKADLTLFETDNKYNPLIIATNYFMDRLDINLY